MSISVYSKITASNISERLSEKEDASNKVTSVSSTSTDLQYPSAKCTYDTFLQSNSSTSTTPLVRDADTLQGYSVSQIIDLIYPIGSIYMSINPTTPATLFGGTWEAIEDTFLLSAGSTYTAGATGGEATHKLTVSEMPRHNHNATYWVQSGGYGRVNDTSVSDARRCNISANPYTGGDEAHNNMPPYLVVYMWKRTA